MRKGRSIFLSGCLSVAVAARLYAEHREPAMAIEQIYRGFTIMGGGPYHK